jgi:dipeptidyl aminopeptidase/acylaminoacyl peptidase
MARAAASDLLPGDLDARVAHAQQFASAKLFAKVRNSGLSFHWIGDTDRFWYRKSIPEGRSVFMSVDAATGRQQVLFDNQEMTAALSAAGVTGVASIVNVKVPSDARSILVTVAQPGATCLWPQTYQAPRDFPRCNLPTDAYACDLPVTACRTVVDPQRADVVMSPDRRQAIFVRDHNLWLRDTTDGTERQLTRDGVENFAYGKVHGQTDYARVERRRAGLPDPLFGVFWSPDGRYVLALRYDLRKVPEREVVTEYLPPEGGRPIVHSDRLAIAADAKYPDATLAVIDVAGRTVRATNANPQMFGEIAAANYLKKGKIWWTDGSQKAWVIGVARGGREERLIRIDIPTAAATDVIVEKSAVPISPSDIPNVDPVVGFLSSGKEVVWFSQRDGWGHLYLYDTVSGRVKRQITRGPWVVEDLLRVDEVRRRIIFTAVGREPNRNVYYRHLYSVSVDGGEPRLLTPENADHEFFNSSTRGDMAGGSVSPSGKYFIDSYSTYSQPDKVVIRTIDGKLVSDVVAADVSELTASGWRPPEPFVVKAADGKSDLYGLLFKPLSFDPAKKYPLIEVSYPAPTLKFAPTTFRDNFLDAVTLNAHAFAEIGAIVVGFEGRGGAMRSVAFRSAFLGTDDPVGSADHVAAIRNVAATRPYIDLDRVGATGHSWGGYSVLRGMLLYPDFYKVVVSGEGPASYFTSSIDIATERFLGIPTDPATIEYYRRFSNESLADRLRGKLLIIHAAADEGVPFQNALQIYAAFQKANKVYDTLIMPDSPHFGGREPYGVMRTIRYFAQYLGGPE